jgi:hypothetical protein
MQTTLPKRLAPGKKQAGSGFARQKIARWKFSLPVYVF